MNYNELKKLLTRFYRGLPINSIDIERTRTLDKKVKFASLKYFYEIFHNE